MNSNKKVPTSVWIILLVALILLLGLIIGILFENYSQNQPNPENQKTDKIEKNNRDKKIVKKDSSTSSMICKIVKSAPLKDISGNTVDGDLRSWDFTTNSYSIWLTKENLEFERYLLDFQKQDEIRANKQYAKSLFCSNDEKYNCIHGKGENPSISWNSKFNTSGSVSLNINNKKRSIAFHTDPKGNIIFSDFLGQCGEDLKNIISVKLGNINQNKILAADNNYNTLNIYDTKKNNLLSGKLVARPPEISFIKLKDQLVRLRGCSEKEGTHSVGSLRSLGNSVLVSFEESLFSERLELYKTSKSGLRQIHNINFESHIPIVDLDFINKDYLYTARSKVFNSKKVWRIYETNSNENIYTDSAEKLVFPRSSYSSQNLEYFIRKNDTGLITNNYRLNIASLNNKNLSSLDFDESYDFNNLLWDYRANQYYLLHNEGKQVFYSLFDCQ